MYGLPGQSMDTWLQTLETALSFAPEHLSCYQLTIAAGRRPLARRLARGEFTLPDEEAQRDFFLLTRQFLEDRGYIQYEISNFARGEEYLCRHNRKYWNHTPYLGLGPAAHSFRAGRRWWNFSSVAQYGAALNAGEAPVAGSENPHPGATAAGGPLSGLSDPGRGRPGGHPAAPPLAVVLVRIGAGGAGATGPTAG